MIYPYKYLENHPIEKLHSYLNFFFSVMFNDANKRFNKSKLIHSDFRGIFDHYEKISKPLRKIFKVYHTLTTTEQRKLKNAFENNNKIAEICSNAIEPIQYFELDSSIRDVIYDFYIFLWESALAYKNVVDNGSSVTAHFEEFVNPTYQQVLICPFCGLETLLSSNDAKDGKRDDYDHYIPKKLYPFNSVNFKNLVPMCHRCNSKYKGQKDTIFKERNKVSRRKVFFPFDSSLASNKIELKIDTDEVTLSDNDNWTICISDSQGYNEEIESWNDIFDIKSRYKNKIKQFEKVWIEGILKKYKREISRGTYEKSLFQEDFLDDIDIFDTVNGIIQHAYYDFFFENLDLELLEPSITGD
jgi:hypothetical protein